MNPTVFGQSDGFAWMCVEHSSIGWSASEDECFCLSDHHLYLHTSSFARAIINLLRTAWASTDPTRAVADTIRFLREEHPAIGDLPEAVWEFDGTESGFLSLVERFLVTDCCLIIADVNKAAFFYESHREGVDAVAAVEGIPIIFAAQLVLDSEMGYDDDFRTNQMMEEIEEWLQHQQGGEQ